MDVQKLFIALKTKYPQSGLSDKEIMGLAVSLFATGLVTDENLQTIVDGQADAIKSMQSVFDSRFGSQREALKKTIEAEFEKTFKEKYHIGEDGKQVAGQTTPQTDDIKALIAQVMDEKLKPLSDKITAEETRRAAEARTLEIIEKAKANGISEAMAKMLHVPEDVTDLDGFFKDKAQELKNNGFQSIVPPSQGGNSKTDGEAIADLIRESAPKTENQK